MNDTSVSPIYNYRAFGLHIQSSLDCPELLPGQRGEPDLRICLGHVPDNLDEAWVKERWYQAAPGRLLLLVEGVAKFMVIRGREIMIERAPEAGDETVRLFLLGSAMGALLHQRGMLPLHGSAVAVNGGGVIFGGPSGHGKSTLAAALAHRGYSILADDVCVLSCDGKDVRLVPSYPQLKLWGDAVDRLGYTPKSLRRIRPEIDKHGLPVAKEFCDQVLSLRHIYVLDPSETSDFKITPLKGIEKIKALIENTYRYLFLPGLGEREGHFKRCAAVANQVIISRVSRPEGRFALDELVALLEKEFAWS
jgi:hypothetical protein